MFIPSTASGTGIGTGSGADRRLKRRLRNQGNPGLLVIAMRAQARQ